MRETLKMMKGIITGKEKETEEIDLIKEYQTSLSSNILAYFFINNFGMIDSISQLYSKIDEQDRASFCLQELDKCLKSYNLKSNNKFTTYFYSCYKNRLRMEFEQINKHKRKIQYFYLEEYDVKKCEEYSYIDDIELEEEIEDTLDDWNLNDKEKKLCKLLNSGYKTKEIAKIFKLKPASIYKKTRLVQEKILKLV
jgi:hypothetical protein